MKTRFLPILILLNASLVAAAPAARADEPPSARHEMASVEQFLNLTDAELDQLQAVIARLRAMTPGQRATLRDEIRRYRQLPEAQREELRAGWGWMPREIQDGWRELMRSASPERRAAIHAELQALAPGQRTARRRQLVEEFLKSKPSSPPGP